MLETRGPTRQRARVANAVRFGFWGAEEVGIVGSRKYIESLDMEQLKDIALYLNFDMIGSPTRAASPTTATSRRNSRRPEAAAVPRDPRHRANLRRLPQDRPGRRPRTPASTDDRITTRSPSGRDPGAACSPGGGREVDPTGRTVGRDAECSIRPELSQGHRHSRSHRPHRLGHQWQRGRLGCRHVRPESQRPQRDSGPRGPHPPRHHRLINGIGVVP